MHAIGEGAHGTMAKDNVDELQDWIALHRPVDRAIAKERSPSPPKKVQLKCPPKQSRGRAPTKVRFKGASGGLYRVLHPPSTPF